MKDPVIELVRFYLGELRTIGRFTYEYEDYYTIERPWKDNTPFISCIPDGVYTVERRHSVKFGRDMWTVLDVDGRTHILLHIGNTEDDVVGCIGVSSCLYSTLTGVGRSKDAMERFETTALNEKRLTLIIRTGHLTE